MDAYFEGRTSDSPYIEMIWRGHFEHEYSPVCPADARWNLLFRRYGSHIKVTAEGATTHFVPKTHHEAAEFLVVKFKLGTFMPYLPAGDLLNVDALLPDAVGNHFWLNSAVWQFPDYDNVETFVDQLVREGALITDPVVKAAMQEQPQPISDRTVRRRFLHSTGLTYNGIQQIERAHQAVSLLEQGLPILDTVYETGYADQPHMTRALRRFIGQTPAQIARSASEMVGVLA
jgi:hypothetical protein